MKLMRRGLALVLALLLILPGMPASAEEPVSLEPEAVEETQTAAEEEGKPKELPKATPSNASPSKKVPSDAVDKEVTEEEIRFNTGNHEWSIVDREIFDKGTGDGCFEEDGSYTINIPEENPFFPYEVQFTYQGDVTNQWFMTPDDSIQIGEHTFYVSAHFDDTVVTQMELNVSGDTVVVYPAAKEFTNDGDGAMPMSLLPLEERSLTVDLSGYTPAELTMVSLSSVFTGANELKDTDKVAWAYLDQKLDYTVSTAKGVIDLSRSTSSGSTTWQMIVGDGTQLNPTNVRNIVRLTVTRSMDWLTAAVYTQDSSGKRAKIEVARDEYYDYSEERQYYVTVPYEKLKDVDQAYVGLSVNSSVFGSTKYDHMKVYEGQYTDAAKAVSGKDITAQICNTNMAQSGAGYLLKKYKAQWVTMVTFDQNNKATGCLPFNIQLNAGSNSVYVGGLYYRTADHSVNVSSDSNIVSEGASGYRSYIENLYAGYAANSTYYLTMYYYNISGISSSEAAKAITAAYEGDYASIAKANSAGAKNIKDVLFDSNSSTGGYPADYSRGVNFTVFVGADGTANQEIYHLNVKTEEGTVTLNSGTGVRFSGLKDNAGKDIDCYVVDYDEDSYAEYSYLTILVGPDVDVTNLAPVFSAEKGINLYAAGASSPEVSGNSRHDFSKGAVHYTASSENKENQRNYWLQVVKATNGAGWIYINSLADSDSKTTKQGGVTRSTREVMLNGYYDYKHDILLANMGTNALADLSVELSSSVLELDNYWTLNGSQDLSGFSTTQSGKNYGGLPNMAKIRVKAKSNAAKGTDISGTLTIKSGSTTLVVLTLTGLIGDPCITTETLPQAVKYVPYGTMIQNNNKYSFNKVSYRLLSGELPEGMEVKPNGEVYGVPKKAGTFTFTVQMQNSYSKFSSDEKTYTLTVLENTDANVDGATDTGYNLTQRIQDIYLGEINDSLELMKVCESLGQQTMVSQGEYVEFVDIFLDGKKLVPGSEYTSNSGSTRITIGAETLVVGGEGTHTLGIEFRTGDDQILKRAAQNYRVYFEDAPDNENNSSSGRSRGGHGGDDVNYATVVMRLVDASGKAMPGLTLELHSTPKITKTDQNGIAIFYGVESGKHTLFVKDSNGNVLASKSFEVVFGDTTLLNGDQIIIKKGAASTLNMQMNGNALIFLSLQAGDIYQVVPASTGDEADSRFWFSWLLAFAGIGAAAYWWYDKKKKQFNN